MIFRLRHQFVFVCFVYFVVGVSPLTAQDANWPQFRGPRGDGTSLASKPPLHWSEQSNVVWKTAIHGRAWSSPVLWGNQLWLTTATEDGRELYAVCVEPQTGKVTRDLKLFDVAKPQYCHPFNSYASPTPVLEEGRLYVSFGAPGLACLDTATGQVLWSRRDFECNHFRGAGSSPILYSNLFILNFDGSDHQVVVALDKSTGRTVWQTKRSINYDDLDVNGKPLVDGDYRKAFATCNVAELDGHLTLLSQGSKALYGYEPLTGVELWRVEERTSYSGSTRPLVANFGSQHGAPASAGQAPRTFIFFPSGFSSGQVLAIHPGKPGEVLDAKTNAAPSMGLQVVWKTKKNAPKKPSLQLVNDLLYGLDDNGVVTCWEALTGNTVWSEKVGGHFSASPIAAAGRLYLFSEEGKTIVLAAGRQFSKLAENQLGDGFMASPALTGNALFLRSRTHLYRIQE